MLKLYNQRGDLSYVSRIFRKPKDFAIFLNYLVPCYSKIIFLSLLWSAPLHSLAFRELYTRNIYYYVKARGSLIFTMVIGTSIAGSRLTILNLNIEL